MIRQLGVHITRGHLTQYLGKNNKLVDDPTKALKFRRWIDANDEWLNFIMTPEFESLGLSGDDTDITVRLLPLPQSAEIL